MELKYNTWNCFLNLVGSPQLIFELSFFKKKSEQFRQFSVILKSAES